MDYLEPDDIRTSLLVEELVAERSGSAVTDGAGRDTVTVGICGRRLVDMASHTHGYFTLSVGSAGRLIGEVMAEFEKAGLGPALSALVDQARAEARQS